MSKKIHLITTGGTIDSEYNGVLDTVTARDHSVVLKFLEGINVDRQFVENEVCLKDSRMITGEDRADIVAAIKDVDVDRVLITHGTYTIPETAQFLDEQLGDTDKTIVLTGSLVPLDGFTMTDAGFNLGFAVAQLDVLPAGVYVCLNATVFTPQEVVKLANENRFVSTFFSAKDKRAADA